MHKTTRERSAILQRYFFVDLRNYNTVKTEKNNGFQMHTNKGVFSTGINHTITC